MDIEQYLQASLVKAKEPQTYFAEGVEVNSQEAILETHGQEDPLETFDFEEKIFPSEISLLLRVVPEKLTDVKPNYSMTYVVDGYHYGPLPFVEISGGIVPLCCSAIDMYWDGEGSQRGETGTVEKLCDNLKDLSLGLVYRKKFNLPPGDSFRCEENLHGGASYYECAHWNTPRENERPLIPFGGYMMSGLDPVIIMPLYAMIGGGDRTNIILQSQNFWRKLGVYPGVRGKRNTTFVTLVDLPEPYVVTTLAEDIRAGSIQVGGEEMSYVSHSYDVVDTVARTILIHFKQR